MLQNICSISIVNADILLLVEDKLTVPWISDLVLNFSSCRICLQGGIQNCVFWFRIGVFFRGCFKPRVAGLVPITSIF